MTYFWKKMLVMSIVYGFVVAPSVSIYAQENPIIKIMSEGVKGAPSKRPSSCNRNNDK